MTNSTNPTTAQVEHIYAARQDRREHPAGSFDNAGRWYPAKGEQQACCTSIRYPSRAYPYSLMVHCRTRRHVAQLVASNVAEVQA